MKLTQTQILCKTILYRLLGLMLMLGIGFWFTGDLQKTVQIGIVTECAQTALYYAYEQFWN